MSSKPLILADSIVPAESAVIDSAISSTFSSLLRAVTRISSRITSRASAVACCASAGKPVITARKPTSKQAVADDPRNLYPDDE